MTSCSRLNPVRIVFRDPISISYLWAIFLSWALIVNEARGKPDFVSGTFLLVFYFAVRAITVGMVVLMPAMLVSRVRRVQRVLQNGAVTTGRIKGIRRIGLRDSMVAVEFLCGGQATMARIALGRKKVQKWGLKKDDEIGLVVDETAPRDTLIRRLYC